MWQWRAAKCQPGETTNLWGYYKALVMVLQRLGNEATKPLVSYGLSLNWVHPIFGVIQAGVYRGVWRLDVRIMDV